MGEAEAEGGKAIIALVIGSIVYYQCAYRNSTLLSLFSDVVFIVLLCSLAIQTNEHLCISISFSPLN
ncbi:hypothetical protein AAZX31_08G221200 [Glycine max]